MGSKLCPETARALAEDLVAFTDSATDEDWRWIPDKRVSRYSGVALDAALQGRRQTFDYTMERLMSFDSPQARNEARLLIALESVRTGCFDDAEHLLLDGVWYGHREFVPVSPEAVRTFGHLVAEASQHMVRTDNGSSLLNTVTVRLQGAIKTLSKQEGVWD